MNNNASQASQDKPDGNTKTSGPKHQLYRWCFTLDMEKFSASQLSQNLKGFCKEFYFQGEKAPTTGYEHWQGVISLRNKEYLSTVKNLIDNTVHLEPCKNWHASKNYAGKIETRICGPYDHTSVFLNTITELREWQKKVLKIIKEDNDRYIWWFYDNGNTGKTAFAKFLAVHYGAIVFNNAGTRDIAMAIPDNPSMIIFNYTRSNEERINYQALESIKDGLIFSGKYESKMKIFNSPTVIVFANYEPHTEMLSADRWKIFHTNNIDE